MLQVDAHPMGVLGMLQEEPGAGEVLLACRAHVAGRFISTCKREEEKRKRHS